MTPWCPADQLDKERAFWRARWAKAVAPLKADPRTRWRFQAEAVLADLDDERRSDLLELFAEREAIASVDGGVDDDTAGRLAYLWLLTRLGQVPIRSGVTEGADK